MKNIFKAFTMTLLLALLVSASVSANPARAEAKVKDGIYGFTPSQVTKFQIKDGTMTLKVDKADLYGITKNNDQEYKSYKLKAKVSKNCKYVTETYVRGIGELDSRKITDYNEIKGIIDMERNFYKESGYVQNVVTSYLKVKNNKVVKIVYCAM